MASASLAGSLPVYEPLSDSLAASLTLASSFGPDNQEDDGAVIISYKFEHISAASVKASDFVLLPSRPPAVNEDFNFALLEESGFLIFAWRTTLKDLSFLQYIVRYGETAEATVSERIQCTTPEFFIVAAGVR